MLGSIDPNAPGGEFALERFFDLTEAGAFRLFDLLVGLVLSALLTLAFVQTYRASHRGATYSVAFLQSLFILSSCTTLIMVVIGSNIARAFSLVGALSIIRFRTAMKDPRDVGFVFATLAVGMGCGTGFYGATILFTLFVCALLLVLGKLNVGQARSNAAVLRVTVGPADRAATVARAEALLRTADANPVLVNRIVEKSTGEETLAWRVRTGDASSQGRLQQSVHDLEGVTAVGIYALDDFHVL